MVVGLVIRKSTMISADRMTVRHVQVKVKRFLKVQQSFNLPKKRAAQMLILTQTLSVKWFRQLGGDRVNTYHRTPE